MGTIHKVMGNSAVCCGKVKSRGDERKNPNTKYISKRNNSISRVGNET